MNKNFVVTIISAVLLAGYASTPATVHAQSINSQCDKEQMKQLVLRLGNRWMRLRPARGPKCLPVADSSDVDTEFSIVIEPRPKKNEDYIYPDGTVRVATSPDSALKRAGGLSFSGSNVGNLITVTVTGDASSDPISYFDIVADGIGTLDPRVRVVDETAYLGHLAGVLAELREFLELYEVVASEYDDSGAETLSSDEFIRNAYGLEPEEVDQLIREFGVAE